MDRHRAEALTRALVDDDPRLDLIAAAIAGADSSAPSIDELVAELDELASGAPPSAGGLIRHVFANLGFTGNTSRYYHPSNSLLHKVLHRRIGNPLSLATVAAEISRRAGGTLCVVGFPGHVLIGDDAHPSSWYDPFLGGDPMDLAGCRSLLARMRPGEAFHPAMVRQASKYEVAQRMLNNLDVAWRQTGDISRLVSVMELRLAFPDAGSGERRQLAHTLIAAGRPFRAAQVLEELTAIDPDNGEEYQRIRHRLLAHAN